MLSLNVMAVTCEALLRIVIILLCITFVQKRCVQKSMYRNGVLNVLIVKLQKLIFVKLRSNMQMLWSRFSRVLL